MATETPAAQDEVRPLEMNKEELEQQYSPSRWSHRFSASDIIPAHLQASSQSSQAARDAVKHRLDVPYADKPRTRCDVFGEDLPNDAPVLVYVHGGYWQELSKDTSAYLVQPLHQAGVMTVVVGYTLAPQESVGGIVEEIRAVVSWACELACTRGSKGVVLSGWSAGGHLVTQVLSTWSEGVPAPQHKGAIKGVVTFSGVFDLRPLVPTYVNDPLKLTTSEAWALSPQRVVKGLAKGWGEGLRVLASVGQYDSPEFKRQSSEYVKACQDEGMKAHYFEVSEADHFNIVEDLSEDGNILTKRLRDFVLECCAK